MKKKLIFILTLTLFMIFPTISSKAATKINFTEASNGIVNTTIQFEEGFVGGVDVVFKVSDTVKVKNFEFNSEFKKYTKKYSYDSINHTLRVIVTSGGIGQAHNLLNSKKVLTLGKIDFETSSNKSVDYSLDKVSLMYNDNNWKSTTIPSSELILGEKNKFTYVVNEETNPPKDNNQSGNTGGGIDNNNSSTGATPNQSSGNSSNSQSETPTPNSGNIGDGKEDDVTSSNDEENQNDDVIDDDNITSNDNNATDNKTETDNKTNDKENKSKNKTVLIISIVAIALVVGILIIIYLTIKSKKTDIDF